MIGQRPVGEAKTRDWPAFVHDGNDTAGIEPPQAK
jgi:hypothetical protein